MKKRIGVQFRKTHKTANVFERLKACRHCHTYHVLWETECSVCGREYQPIREISAKVTRRYVQTRFLLLALFVCLAILSADTLLQIGVAIGGGIVLSALFFVLQKKYGIYEKNRDFLRYLTNETENIKKSLLKQQEEIGADVKEERFKDAYEKIREVSHFLHSDTIKIRKIMYLNHFILRKDMELELDSLIPSSYDKDFVEYLREVIKVKPELVKRSVLTYVSRYKSRILLHESGEQLIGQVAGAALRMSAYVEEFQDLIIEFIDYLPRERLLRLARMVSNHHQPGWERLAEATKRRIETHYSFDPDFNSVL